MNKLLITTLILTTTAFCGLTQVSGARGADATGGDTATNEITAALAELQKQVPGVDTGSAALFINARDREARLAVAAQRRQEALAARQKIPQEIEPDPAGAVARFGALRVSFASDASGGIVLISPDGLRLRSRLAGLCYWSDSKTVMLGNLKGGTIGEIVNPTTVCYRDALTGASADLVYEYRDSGSVFEQNLVIRKQLPTPADCGFSESEMDRVKLAVLTEFFDDIEPRRTPLSIDLTEAYRSLGMQRSETLPDETLTFGAVRIIGGESFSLGEPDLSVPSGKAWRVFEGPEGETKRYLIESTPYRLLKPLLDALPVRTAFNKARQSKDLETALAQLGTPAAGKTTSKLMARIESRVDAQPGVVLDYLLVTTPLLNVDFGWGGKSGFAAFGQQSSDKTTPAQFGSRSPMSPSSRAATPT